MSDTPSSPEAASAPDTGQPADELIVRVYEQLRKIAQERINEERRGHTLSATALVHEAYVRLAANAASPWSGSAHFFHAASEAMRRILIEHARARGRIKRGGGASRVPLSVVDLAIEHDPDEILALDEAICRLEQQDARMAQIVRLRFFAGLDVDSTATALGVSPRTVKSEWRLARAWLHQALRTD